MRCIHIGLLYVQESVINRPTMIIIVLMLYSYSITLPVTSQPAFFMYSNIELDHNLEATMSNTQPMRLQLLSYTCLFCLDHLNQIV